MAKATALGPRLIKRDLETIKLAPSNDVIATYQAPKKQKEKKEEEKKASS